MKKLLYLGLGALMCMSFMSGCSNEKAANALKDAIYLEKPVIDKANEGKLVIIHGVAKMTKGATDPDLNLTFDSPCVTREVQVLTSQTKTTTTTTTNTKSTDKNATNQTTQTKKTTTEYIWKDNNTKNDRAPWRNNESFYGEAKIGQFTISGPTLNTMFNNKRIDVTRDMASKSGLIYWKQGLARAFLTNRRVVERFMQSGSELRAQNEGISRISFNGKEKTARGEYTIAGIQQGNKIISNKDFRIQCYSGVLTKDQMIEKNK